MTSHKKKQAVDGGERMDYQLLGVFLVCFFIIILLWIINKSTIKGLQSTIDRQQDTIQRLINREPVTYAEVGSKPSKKSTDVYAAWGSQMVNIDEDEQHS